MSDTPPASRAWFDLARAGNFPSVGSNVVAALVLSVPQAGRPLADAGLLTFPTVFGGLLAGALLYAGGATLNDVADAHFDAANRPERAIPRGVIARRTALIAGIVELVLGALLLLVLRANWMAVAGVLAVILLYDWLHKRWSGSVLLMAACRGLLAVALGTIPGHAMGNYFVGWLIALYAYIVVLSLLARREYKTGNPQSGKSIARLLAFIPLVDAAALLVAQQWGPAAFCIVAVFMGKWAQRIAAAT